MSKHAKRVDCLVGFAKQVNKNRPKYKQIAVQLSNHKTSTDARKV